MCCTLFCVNCEKPDFNLDFSFKNIYWTLVHIIISIFDKEGEKYILSEGYINLFQCGFYFQSEIGDQHKNWLLKNKTVILLSTPSHQFWIQSEDNRRHLGKQGVIGMFTIVRWLLCDGQLRLVWQRAISGVVYNSIGS